MKHVTSINFWTPREDDLIFKHYPNIGLLLSVLNYRSRTAIQKRAKRLGARDGRRKPWTCQEVITLRRCFETMAAKDVVRMLPGRSYNSIRKKAKSLGVVRHRRPRLIPVGIKLIDEIRIEAFRRNMTTVDLDFLAKTGDYFSSKFKHKPVDFYACAQAIKLLEGNLEMIWDNRRIQIV